MGSNERGYIEMSIEGEREGEREREKSTFGFGTGFATPIGFLAWKRCKKALKEKGRLQGRVVLRH